MSADRFALNVHCVQLLVPFRIFLRGGPFVSFQESILTAIAKIYLENIEVRPCRAKADERCQHRQCAARDWTESLLLRLRLTAEDRKRTVGNRRACKLERKGNGGESVRIIVFGGRFVRQVRPNGGPINHRRGIGLSSWSIQGRPKCGKKD
jgi:hypothetical protein